jgi:hypothetical protein
MAQAISIGYNDCRQLHATRMRHDLSQDPEIDLEALIRKLVEEAGAEEAIRRIAGGRARGSVDAQ